MSFQEACQVLNLDPREASSNPNAVRSAYKKMALEFHPDKHPGASSTQTSSSSNATGKKSSGGASGKPTREDFERKFRQVVRAYDALTRRDDSDDSESDEDDFGGPNGDFDGVFKSPEDMRDFAANFFESFFFGGGFAQGSNGPSGRSSRKRRSTHSGNANASSGGGGPIIKEVNDDGEEYSDEDSDDESSRPRGSRADAADALAVALCHAHMSQSVRRLSGAGRVRGGRVRG